MKRIFCLTLLSVAAFADPYSYIQQQNQRVQQQMFQQQLLLQQRNMQDEQMQMEKQAQAEAQHQMRIAAYQKAYENNPAKEKQLDECVNQLLIRDSGKKWNPTPCLDYTNPNK